MEYWAWALVAVVVVMLVLGGEDRKEGFCYTMGTCDNAALKQCYATVGGGGFGMAICRERHCRWSGSANC